VKTSSVKGCRTIERSDDREFMQIADASGLCDSARDRSPAAAESIFRQRVDDATLRIRPKESWDLPVLRRGLDR
jgi:hypothetical protein